MYSSREILGVGCMARSSVGKSLTYIDQLAPIAPGKFATHLHGTIRSAIAALLYALKISAIPPWGRPAPAWARLSRLPLWETQARETRAEPWGSNRDQTDSPEVRPTTARERLARRSCLRPNSLMGLPHPW